MQTVTVSPKFQLQVVQFEDRIELIPLRAAKTLRGTLRGLDTAMPRDGDRA